MDAFFVTVVDAGRTGVLVGPFCDGKEAYKWVDAARTAAYEIDPYSWFYWYGVSRISGTYRLGKLNDRVGYRPTLTVG